RRGSREDRIAIGRRSRDSPRGEIAPGAAAIFYHHRLPKPFGEFLPDQPRYHFGNAAGRERDQDGDVLRRIGLRRRARHAGRYDEGREHNGAAAGEEVEHGNVPSCASVAILTRPALTPRTFGTADPAVVPQRSRRQ